MTACLLIHNHKAAITVNYSISGSSQALRYVVTYSIYAYSQAPNTLDYSMSGS